MLSQSSAKKKTLSSFHVNESHTLHLSIRHMHTHKHSHTDNPPTHIHTHTYTVYKVSKIKI